MKKYNSFLIEKNEEEHQGMWLHGGTGKFKDGNFLYVTDELKEALHYAKLKGGNVYKLKDESLIPKEVLRFKNALKDSEQQLLDIQKNLKKAKITEPVCH